MTFPINVSINLAQWYKLVHAISNIQEGNKCPGVGITCEQMCEKNRAWDPSPSTTHISLYISQLTHNCLLYEVGDVSTKLSRGRNKQIQLEMYWKWISGSVIFFNNMIF